jgi:hypothetical protein
MNNQRMRNPTKEESDQHSWNTLVESTKAGLKSALIVGGVVGTFTYFVVSKKCKYYML